MPRYKLVFRRSERTITDRVVIRSCKSFAEAIAHRIVSGDLITRKGLVVNSQDWLFAWEKTDLDCYAQRAIRHDEEVRKERARSKIESPPSIG